MSKYQYEGEPVKIVRDAGYNKVELLSPEYRLNAHKRVENPNVTTGNYKLKELLAEIGIVVIPEKMTNWYVFDE